jgi:hypothetical protein
MKPDKLQLMQEANRRGILPPEKKALYSEAVKRGLIADQAAEQPRLEQQNVSEPISRGEAALTTFSNIPFAPRIKAGIGAAVAAPFVDDKNYQQLYDEALQNERLKLQQARQQYPIQSIATNLPADIAVGGKLLKVTGLAGQGIKSVLAGAAGLGGLQATGETQDLTNLPQTAKDTLTAAGLSAATAGALNLGAKGFQAGKEILKSKPPVVNADDLKSLASATYKDAAEKGGVLKGWFINNLIGEANKLDKQTTIGKAIGGQSPLTGVKEVLSRFRNKQLDLASLQELDEALSDKIDDFVENGVIKKAGLPLLKLQTSLRKMVDEVNPDMIVGNREGFEALKEGRKLWSKAARLRDVERIITRADMSDNPATALKTGFRTLFNNAEKLKYFSPQERKMIADAAKSGVVGDTLRTMGSRLIPIGSVVAGGGVAGVGASQMATMASRDFATRAQLLKANKLAEEIVNSAIPQKIINKIPKQNYLLPTTIGAGLASPLAMTTTNNNE